MNGCLEGLSYLYDVLVNGSTIEDHLVHLKKILQRLQEKDINPVTFNLFYREVRYIGS